MFETSLALYSLIHRLDIKCADPESLYNTSVKHHPFIPIEAQYPYIRVSWGSSNQRFPHPSPPQTFCSTADLNMTTAVVHVS